jgi:hypothetical protein
VPLGATDLLPERLPAAWKGTETAADHLRTALSADLGKALPWITVRRALDQGFKLGLFERTLDSGPWPCDLGGAPAVRLRFVQGLKDPGTAGGQDATGAHGSAKTATATLEAHDLVDLGEAIDAVLAAAIGHDLQWRVTVTLDRAGGASAEAIEGINAVLEKVKKGWMLQ